MILRCTLCTKTLAATFKFLLGVVDMMKFVKSSPLKTASIAFAV